MFSRFRKEGRSELLMEQAYDGIATSEVLRNEAGFADAGTMADPGIAMSDAYFAGWKCEISLSRDRAIAVNHTV